MRPPRHLQLSGIRLPEVMVQRVSPMAGPGDPLLAATAADRVRELLDGGMVVADDHPPRAAGG
jgi:hypothetical protein